MSAKKGAFIGAAVAVLVVAAVIFFMSLLVGENLFKF